MTRSKLLRRLRRPARDFMAGLGVLMALAVFCGDAGLLGHPAHAQFLQAPPEMVELLADFVQGSDAVAPQANPLYLAILAVVSSALLALNLWFFRHLRRVAVRASGRGKN